MAEGTGGAGRGRRAQPCQGAAAVWDDRCVRFLCEPGGGVMPLMDERAVHAGCPRARARLSRRSARGRADEPRGSPLRGRHAREPLQRHAARRGAGPRSEEHTSELQSRLHLVCRLLLEKKKKKKIRLLKEKKKKNKKKKKKIKEEY